MPCGVGQLRERRGDILPLVEHFLNVYKSKLKTTDPQLAPETIRLMLNYAWPGNIRELENVIHRALLVSTSNVLQPKDLNLPYIQQQEKNNELTDQIIKSKIHPIETNYQLSNNQAPIEKLQNILEELFDAAPDNLYELINGITVKKAYEFSKNNQVHTAKLLGISRNILRARLKELDLIA